MLLIKITRKMLLNTAFLNKSEKNTNATETGILEIQYNTNE